MSSMSKEGWYQDPSRRHEWRWFSDGAATELVRDEGITSRDPVLPEEVAAYADLDLEQPPDTAPLIYNPNDVKPKTVTIDGFGAVTNNYDPP